ncbi:MAG: multifunctional CCA tRNA nucleotidyl transferase/2'3'-cyclic phosphodiesterase/2'nucleotidase/phosphatase [Gammaproteobacteria bacterium]|nr:multifunctional CCA tRNA nucleotidyl transferase/2'3'-cyclic phosphodiesterase/2'nucleotidase/phosphatase [Gammaproteobacteria bacterium]
MKVYLVGGAVRDKLLGLPVKERDWVVVGATPKEMLRLGFKKVGRDFPVFLHPKTHEEYALARTERKTGKGYIEFACHFDPEVTLEDDLIRRDLTINAMALDLDGKITDPYDGRNDLKNKILRHVSSAFAEDPVRILRIARFASRFGEFKVHPKTNKLMQEMLANGEVDALVSERVWQELERALGEPYPERFFIVLKNCQVLPKLFPEIAAHLSEIRKALKQAVCQSQESMVRFAAIAFNLDKKECDTLCKRYKLPNAYRELSLLVLRLKNEGVKLSQKSDGVVTLLEHADAYRKPERLKQALLASLVNDKRFKKVSQRVWDAYKITQKVRLTPKIIMQEDKSNLRKILHDKRTKQVEKKLNKKTHSHVLT